MDLGTYKSVDAEIWFEDRFWGDTKILGGNFSRFLGGQSPKFCQNGRNLNFDPLKIANNQNFKKSSHNVFVSPQNLSRNQSSATTDLQVSGSIAFHVKLTIFSITYIFPYN